MGNEKSAQGFSDGSFCEPPRVQVCLRIQVMDARITIAAKSTCSKLLPFEIAGCQRNRNQYHLQTC